MVVFQSHVFRKYWESYDGECFSLKKKILQKHFKIIVFKSERLNKWLHKKISEQKQIFYMMVVTMHILYHPEVKRVKWVLGSNVYLQISALRLEPVLDEILGIIAEAQHEVSLSLQLVDVLNSLMYLQWIQPVEKQMRCSKHREKSPPPITLKASEVQLLVIDYLHL